MGSRHCLHEIKSINVWFLIIMTIAIEQCNRDDWIEGVWTLAIGSTLLASAVFGLLKGKMLYAFASDGSGGGEL